jgi:hypothetical protein
MTAVELMPTIESMPLAERRQLLDLIVAGITRADADLLQSMPGECAIWTPFDATEGAAVLQKLLHEPNVED